jgi:hypothetical protein
MNLRLQPVQVATGSDGGESRLVFHESFLVAMLVRMSDEHGAEVGKWFLEAAFGRVDDPNPPIFADLNEAQAWITSQLA